jgi:hypothetical protein
MIAICGNNGWMSEDLRRAAELLHGVSTLMGLNEVQYEAMIERFRTETPVMFIANTAKSAHAPVNTEINPPFMNEDDIPF